jgi:hypothetical protein
MGTRGPRGGRLLRGAVGVAAATIYLFAQAALCAAAPTHPPGIIGSPPPPPFVVLGKGRVDGRGWDGIVYQDHDGLCSEVAVHTESLVVCGHPTPLTVTSLTTRGHSGKEVTALSLVALPRVWTVQLTLLGRPTKTVRPRHIRTRRARRAHVWPALRVAMRVVRGPFCLHQFIAFNKAHQKIFTSFEHQCDEQ